MNEPDSRNLDRFLLAQEHAFESALKELKRGRKESHWIWYIFPQVAGLGHSPAAERYAIRSRDEAVAYLEHPVLRDRLEQCCQALLHPEGKDIHQIMGYPDDLKLRSSMTLFARVSPPGNIFQKVLDAFYSGQADERTITFLED